MYLTYEEYQTLGGTLASVAFERFELLARGHVDRLTHGRVASDTTVRPAVKALVFEIVLFLADTDRNARSGTKSSSNMSVSATFLSDYEIRVRIASLATSLLSEETTAEGIPLLYAGVAL